MSVQFPSRRAATPGHFPPELTKQSLGQAERRLSGRKPKDRSWPVSLQTFRRSDGQLNDPLRLAAGWGVSTMPDPQSRGRYLRKMVSKLRAPTSRSDRLSPFGEVRDGPLVNALQAATGRQAGRRSRTGTPTESWLRGAPLVGTDRKRWKSTRSKAPQLKLFKISCC